MSVQWDMRLTTCRCRQAAPFLLLSSLWAGRAQLVMVGFPQPPPHPVQADSRRTALQEAHGTQTQRAPRCTNQPQPKVGLVSRFGSVILVNLSGSVRHGGATNHLRHSWGMIEHRGGGAHTLLPHVNQIHLEEGPFLLLRVAIRYQNVRF